MYRNNNPKICIKIIIQMYMEKCWYLLHQKNENFNLYYFFALVLTTGLTSPTTAGGEGDFRPYLYYVDLGI